MGEVFGERAVTAVRREVETVFDKEMMVVLQEAWPRVVLGFVVAAVARVSALLLSIRPCHGVTISRSIGQYRLQRTVSPDQVRPCHGWTCRAHLP